jgi:hypothetical protein
VLQLLLHEPPPVEAVREAIGLPSQGTGRPAKLSLVELVCPSSVRVCRERVRLRWTVVPLLFPERTCVYVTSSFETEIT